MDICQTFRRNLHPFLKAEADRTSAARGITTFGEICIRSSRQRWIPRTSAARGITVFGQTLRRNLHRLLKVEVDRTAAARGIAMFSQTLRHNHHPFSRVEVDRTVAGSTELSTTSPATGIFEGSPSAELPYRHFLLRTVPSTSTGSISKNGAAFRIS